jgi:ribokinase
MGSIVCFGSFVVDLTSRAGHLPVPGETVIGSSFRMGPGGKGSNQSVAAHRSGGNVIAVTKVGNDVFGKVALDFYRSEGMSTGYVFIDEAVETGTALIMVDQNTAQNCILVVNGASGNFTDADIEKARPVIEQADVLLLQLEINLDALYRIIDIAFDAGVKIVLNTAPVQKIKTEVFAKVDTVTPNEVEAGILTGVEVKDEESAARAAGVFLGWGVRNVVITMGKAGAFVANAQKKEFIRSIEVRAIDTTGAGDAFNGGFVTALAEGKDIFEAAKFANAAGALSVTKTGTAPAMPYRAEIDALIGKIH